MAQLWEAAAERRINGSAIVSFMIKDRITSAAAFFRSRGDFTGRHELQSRGASDYCAAAF
jgi:hypothetical protein